MKKQEFNIPANSRVTTDVCVIGDLSQCTTLSNYNGLAVWFCKPTTPLQFNDKLSKAYKLYRLLYAWRSKTQKL